jgi:pimeloyl-ACP methyl ester carboxylesterase
MIKAAQLNCRLGNSACAWLRRDARATRIIAWSNHDTPMTVLHYVELGDGEPLVLLHGLFGSGTNLRGLAKRLAGTHRVILADLRNHGRSPHAPGMTYMDMAADLDVLLTHLEVENAHFVGHSMGGKAAMVLALTRARRVRRLVVIDVAPVVYAHSYAVLIGALRGVELSQLRSRGDADAALAAAVPDEATRMFLLQNLVSEAGRYRWRLNLAALEHFMDTIVGFPQLPERRFHGPVLFVAGDQSDYIRAEHEARIIDLFPKVRIERIAGAGHWVHVDQPRALFKTLQDFLRP